MPPRFDDQVVECLAALLQDGFVPARTVATSSFVALVKRSSASVCLYLFARDDRRGPGPVRIDLWVAPIDYPDDRLDALGIGFKTLIASSAQLDPELLSGAVERVR